jgi:hypothetical protein
MRNRTGSSHLTVVAISALVAISAAAAGAQDIPKGKDIDIHLAGNPVRISKVLPTDKGVCPGHHTEDCEDDVNWALKGKTLPADWSVEISLKAGATKKCFPDAPYKLTAANKSQASGPLDAKACTRWDVWPYDVILRDGKGAELQRVDPLVVLNY